MSDCCNKLYLKNGKLEEFVKNPLPETFELTIYEVVRVVDGCVLFLDDHLERFKNSLKLSNIPVPSYFDAIERQLAYYISEIKLTIGNLKFCLVKENDSFQFLIYQIQHSYPTPEQYRTGVEVISHQVVRANPNVKVVHSDIKQIVGELFASNPGIYEIALLDDGNRITEGSKSNLFFVKGNRIYTAHAEKVLCGITRKYVIECAREIGIQCIETDIEYAELNFYEAAFISGTSPKVLPIRKIDQVQFDPLHPTIQKIANQYDALIANYIKSKTRQ